MNGTGGVSNNNQAQELQQRHLDETQRGEALEEIGAGTARSANLSVAHNAAPMTMEAIDGISLAAIPAPEEGALNAVNMMDTNDLTATITGLRGETDEVQSQLQEEAIEQQRANVEIHNEERLEQLTNELQSVEDGNKCAQQTAKICMCIPGLNIMVGLPALAISKSRDDKADAIRAEMMEARYGPEIGGKMAEFMEGYESIAEKGPFANEKQKAETALRLDSLHSQGVIDDVAYFELKEMMNDGYRGAGRFGQHSQVEQRLTELAMGIKTPLLAPEDYPTGMLAANGYETNNSAEEAVTDASLNTEATAPSSGSTEGGSTFNSSDNSTNEWLNDLAQQMQEAEEQDRALSELIEDIQEVNTTVLQSNNDAQQQQGVQQRMI